MIPVRWLTRRVFHEKIQDYRLKVEAAQDKLTASFHGQSSPLEHWHYETFRIAEADLRGTRLTFQMNVRGEIVSVSAPLESAVKEIVFQRVQKKYVYSAYCQIKRTSEFFTGRRLEASLSGLYS